MGGRINIRRERKERRKKESVTDDKQKIISVHTSHFLRGNNETKLIKLWNSLSYRSNQPHI
jgi:hypothetical protein